ncbi:PAS domain-containing sensor histidine kinase [Pedobacter sp. SL55]|uniref:PAS domain-containing sensor histidine kinase n=1 Tax=Pedobacter sp. SL55 TaxID=2995161 RepID=UPI0022711F80|nr:PAS domain-containing sensor histidine kinase [Pedobacter sp. SL55]WAC39387.1 PAS domain-containing sensor histidine kinase [Pedobacter sp. SL55]
MENAVLLKTIIDNAIDGLITIDDRGKIESINPSACKLFDYSEEEVLGNNISMLMPKSHATKHDDYLSKYKQTGHASIIGIGRELIGLKKNKKQFPFRLGVSEVKYSGRIVYAGFIHDLTREKQSEAMLKDYANQLEEQVRERTVSLQETIKILQQTKEELSLSLAKEKELGKLKSRFVSIASHEFRTPLSLMQLSRSLIEHHSAQYQNPNITKHLDKINDAVLNITAILNDFLSLEKLETGKVLAEASSFSLMELAQEITEEMQVVLKDGQEIIFKHRGKDQMISLDHNLLKNCIIILIDNAIKYSGNSSSIQFHTKINKNCCTVRICDNGIGIPYDDQKNLFEAFFRAHNTGKIPGNGLGLSILSRYTILMNGKVKFRSRINRGTLFTLTFPKS